jgi:hypothetical protein
MSIIGWLYAFKQDDNNVSRESILAIKTFKKKYLKFINKFFKCNV